MAEHRGHCAAFMVLRAMLLGEEYETNEGEEASAQRLRLFAAFIRSIDVQQTLLRGAIRWTIAGGVATLAIWVVILADKMLS